jgi:hypothetical protein
MAHESRSPDAVLFVLLDAFRADYLDRTRFLKQIAPESLIGTLEEPFGFCPRGAYFGGLSMSEQGYTNLFRFDPERSVFRWTRELAGTRADVFVREQLHTRILTQARAEVPEFAAAYLDPLGIPLPWLSAFDVCEREAPWSRRVGYRSLFHILDDAGRPWMQLSWPYAGWTGPLSNGAIAGAALQRLRREHAFAFIHLPDLDAIGHAHGPGSREMQTALDETDRLCELLVARARQLYDDPLILFTGDHGMLPVVRTVDVARALTDTGLRWGHDFAFFIDSTMVRCWYFTGQARTIARAALIAAGGGHIVPADEQARWGIAGIDPRNAHDVFLADPGVLFSPNFFDWTSPQPARGMHGYAPDVADNRALFLAHRPRHPLHGQCGNVEARRLFPSFLDWLGWDARTFTSVPPVTANQAESAPSIWSVEATPAADAVVEAHLAHITRAIRQRAPQTEAIIIAGGFGRGEGTIMTDGASIRPANDYDIVVVGADGTAVEGLSETLARDLQIDFVDLCPCPALTRSEPLSQWDHDLRYGSRLVWGNPLVVDRLPHYAPAEIGVDEGIFQIGNRSGGLLLGFTGAGEAADAQDLFLMRQATKFLIAIADCWLIAHADYHASYAIRQRRFRDLATGLFSDDVLHAIDAAFTAKLRGTPFPIAGVSSLACVARVALEELERSLRWTGDALEQALAPVVSRRVHVGDVWLARAEGYGLRRLAPDGVADVPACVMAIYRACLAGVRSWPHGPSTRTAASIAALAPAMGFVGADGDDAVLAATARTWLSLFH